MAETVALPASWTRTASCGSVLTPPRGDWLVTHDLPDVFELPPARPEFRASKLADFRRFFPRIVMWCDEHGLTLSAHTNDSEPPRATICVSGVREKLREFDETWGHFLWRWGGVFSRRARDMVMFVVLPPPDDLLLGDFFPYRMSLPVGFSVAAMSERVDHPFTAFIEGNDGQLGFHDEGDRAKARLIDW